MCEFSFWADLAGPVIAAAVSAGAVVFMGLRTLAAENAKQLEALESERVLAAKAQAFELRKGLLVSAVVGAQQMIRCIPGATYGDERANSERFQDAAQSVIAALPVASIQTVHLGRKFLDAVGPTVVEFMFERQKYPPDRPDIEFMIRGLREVLLYDAELRDLIAAVRRDIEIDTTAEQSSAFVVAATTNQIRFEKVIEKIRRSVEE